MTDRPEELAPLSELETRILLVLAQGDLHGYGIAKQLEQDYPEAQRILPTNLYRRLHELVDRGLIANAQLKLDGSGRARKNFTLTDTGRERLASEARRLSALAREIESQSLAAPRGPVE